MLQKIELANFKCFDSLRLACALRDPLIFCFRIDAQLIEHAYRSQFLTMLPPADVGV